MVQNEDPFCLSAVVFRHRSERQNIFQVVCCLLRSFYVLNQLYHQWYANIDERIKYETKSS